MAMESSSSLLCSFTASRVSLISRDMSLNWELEVSDYRVTVARYMVLAVVVGSPPHELQINATVSTVIAFVFVGVSYGVSATITLAQRHQVLFLLHSIFV